MPTTPTDFSVKIGTTNFDGTGSATNLDNANVVLETHETFIPGDGYSAGEFNKSITAVANTWNGDGVKEIKVDAVDTNVTTINFVDVDLNLANSDAGITVNVNNSKRGEIDTGAGDDIVNISVETNDAGWSNEFVINSNDGNDVITFTNAQNSEFTQLDIDAGADDDIINISDLTAYYTDDVSARVLDGGEGNDTIIGSVGNETILGGDGDDTIIGGSGNDYIEAGAGNDSVFFDSTDTDVKIDGGSGLDKLILSGKGEINIENLSNFEAIIGDGGAVQSVTMTLTDGLVVSLGGDTGDKLNFDNAQYFTRSDAVLSDDMLKLIESHNTDVVNFQAYESNNGDIIWTDVDLLAY